MTFLIEVYQSFGETYCLHLQGSRVDLLLDYFLGLLIDIEDEGNMFFRNIGKLPDYTASYPRI
jgi:hypothetical protein